MDVNPANAPKFIEKNHMLPYIRTQYHLHHGNIFWLTLSDLPESNSFNAILVIIDRFSKMIILTAIKDTLTAFQTTEIYQDKV